MPRYNLLHGVFLLIVFSYPAKAHLQEISGTSLCARQNGEFVTRCQKTCRTPCEENPQFYQSHRERCDSILSVSSESASDDPACRNNVLSEDPCKEHILLSSSNSHHPVPPPNCLKSFKYLTCRFEHLSQNAGDLLIKYQDIANYNIKSIDNPEEICQLFKNYGELQSALNRAQKLHEPLTKLQENFNDGSKCLAKVQKWVGSYQAPDLSQKLKQNIVAKLNSKIEPLLESKSKTQDLFTQVKKEQSSMQQLEALIEFGLCEEFNDQNNE